MTTTARIEPGGWSSYEVPELRGTTRFALRVNEKGWPSSPTATVAHTYANLFEDRLKEAPSLTPEAKTMKLYAAQKVDGVGRLLPRGTVSAIPTRKPAADAGRFRKIPAEGGALLDLYFLAGPDDPNASIRPDALWEALRVYVESVDASPTDIRSLNDSLARLILLRAAGIERRPDALPNIGAPN